MWHNCRICPGFGSIPGVIEKNIWRCEQGWNRLSNSLPVLWKSYTVLLPEEWMPDAVIRPRFLGVSVTITSGVLCGAGIVGIAILKGTPASARDPLSRPAVARGWNFLILGTAFPSDKNTVPCLPHRLSKTRVKYDYMLQRSCHLVMATRAALEKRPLSHWRGEKLCAFLSGATKSQLADRNWTVF